MTVEGLNRCEGEDTNNIDVRFFNIKKEIRLFGEQEKQMFSDRMDKDIIRFYVTDGESSLYSIFSQCQKIKQEGGELTPDLVKSLGVIDEAGLGDKFKRRYEQSQTLPTKPVDQQLKQVPNPEGRYWTKATEGKPESLNPFADKLNELIAENEKKGVKRESGVKEVFDRQSFQEILLSVRDDYNKVGDNLLGSWTDLIQTLNEISQKVDRIKGYKENDVLPSDIAMLLAKCINVGRFLGVRTVELLGKYIKNANHIYNYDPTDNKGQVINYAKEVAKKPEKDLTKKEKQYLDLLKEYGIAPEVSEYASAGSSGVIDGVTDFISAFRGTAMAPDKTFEDIIKGGKEIKRIIGEGKVSEIMNQVKEYTNQYPQEAKLQSTYLAGYVLFLLYQIAKGTPPKKIAGIKESNLKKSLQKLCGITADKENDIVQANNRVNKLTNEGKKIASDIAAPKNLDVAIKKDAVQQLKQIMEDIKSGKSSIKMLDKEVVELEKQIQQIEDQLKNMNKLVESGKLDPKVRDEFVEKIKKLGAEAFDKSDNSNVLRGGVTAIATKGGALLALMKARLGEYMVGVGKDVDKETKLSLEFEEIRAENFDKKEDMSIIDKEKIRNLAKDKIISQIHKYLVENNMVEYVSIDKLKAGVKEGNEGEIGKNIDEAIDEFIYKITNGVMKNEKGEYISKVDLLIEKYFLGESQKSKREGDKSQDNY